MQVSVLTIYTLCASVENGSVPHNRMSVDAVGTTVYSYTAGNQLLTEEGPFANDTVTNVYFSRVRTNLSLQQPMGTRTKTGQSRIIECQPVDTVEQLERGQSA